MFKNIILIIIKIVFSQLNSEVYSFLKDKKEELIILLKKPIKNLKLNETKIF